LPDGIFSNQKSKFGLILECLAIKDVCKFYSQFAYLTAIWPILWPFGIFCGHFGIFVVILVYFSSSGNLYQVKSGNPTLST
jgi:hypothetical protein